MNLMPLYIMYFFAKFVLQDIEDDAGGGGAQGREQDVTASSGSMHGASAATATGRRASGGWPC